MSNQQTPPNQLPERLYAPPAIGAPGRQRLRAQYRDLWQMGVLTLSALVLLLAILFFISPSLFTRHYQVFAYTTDISGISKGTDVIQNGYRIGQIVALTPILADNAQHVSPCPYTATGTQYKAFPCFRLTVEIDADWPLPIDTAAAIASAGMLKGNALMIAGGAEKALLRDGDVLALGPRTPDIGTKIGDLSDSIQAVVNNTVKPALESVAAQIKALQQLIGLDDSQSVAGTTLPAKQAGVGSRQLQGAVTNLNEMTERLRDAVDPQAIAKIVKSLEEVSANMVTITSSLNHTAPGLDRAITNYGDLAADARGVIKKNDPALSKTLDSSQYLVQQLTTSLLPIILNLEETSRNLAAFTKDLHEDPKRLLQNRKPDSKLPWFEQKEKQK